MAADEPGSRRVRVHDYPGLPRSTARRTALHRLGLRGTPAAGGSYPLHTRPRHDRRPRVARGDLVRVLRDDHLRAGTRGARCPAVARIRLRANPAASLLTPRRCYAILCARNRSETTSSAAAFFSIAVCSTARHLESMTSI